MSPVGSGHRVPTRPDPVRTYGPQGPVAHLANLGPPGDRGRGDRPLACSGVEHCVARTWSRKVNPQSHRCVSFETYGKPVEQSAAQPPSRRLHRQPSNPGMKGGHH